jgi:hypothetical protein
MSLSLGRLGSALSGRDMELVQHSPGDCDTLPGQSCRYIALARKTLAVVVLRALGIRSCRLSPRALITVYCFLVLKAGTFKAAAVGGAASGDV